MPIALTMADDKPSDEPRDPARAPARDPGAPVPKDAIDPELIKLARTRPTIGVITGAGVVFLCALFLVRLAGDRRFSSSDTPTTVSVADVVAGKIDEDRFVRIGGETLVSHAIRVARPPTGQGHRVVPGARARERPGGWPARGVARPPPGGGYRGVPVRGAGDRLWIVLHGDGWEPPALEGHVGRLKVLADLPIADAVRSYAASHPRPVFAAPAAVRAGLPTGKITTVGGEVVTLATGDRVAFDVIDPDAVLIVATLNERLPDAPAWQRALAAAGVTVGVPIAPPAGAAENRVRFEIKGPGALADVTSKLDAATLYAARIEPITRHFETTWGVLAGSSAAGFTVGTATVPDAQLDLVGLYVSRPIPDGAYALLTGERPADYWHVLPVTIALALLGLLFCWVLYRSVRRDIFPPRVA